jgi:hypothetical protein
LDSQLCDNCLSAQNNCIPNEKVCSIKGNCIGIRIQSEEMATAEDCLQLCNATRGCRWFSFYTLVPECVLFKNCPSIDESCEDCVSGERRCIDEDMSSTTEVTTTTTEMTTTTTEVTTTSITEVTTTTPEVTSTTTTTTEITTTTTEMTTTTTTTTEVTTTTPEVTSTTPEVTTTDSQKVI